jgi:hypothetical protein
MRRHCSRFLHRAIPASPSTNGATGAQQLCMLTCIKVMKPLCTCCKCATATVRSTDLIVRCAHRHAILGCILVKELAWIDKSEAVPVASLKMRSIPTLPASIALYDLLRLFRVMLCWDRSWAACRSTRLLQNVLTDAYTQIASTDGGCWHAQTGRSHVALLVQPPPPRRPEHAGAREDEVHLMVRAESGSAAEHADVVAHHSDPHDPWHQVTGALASAKGHHTHCPPAAWQASRGIGVDACVRERRWCERRTAQRWGRDSRSACACPCPVCTTCCLL